MQLQHMRSMQPKVAAHRSLAAPAAVTAHRPCPSMQSSVLQPLPMGFTMQQQQYQHQPRQQQRHQQQQWVPLPHVQAASGSSSGSSSEPQKPGPGLSWFDRLPAQTQLMVMGGLLFIGAVSAPAALAFVFATYGPVHPAVHSGIWVHVALCAHSCSVWLFTNAVPRQHAADPTVYLPQPWLAWLYPSPLLCWCRL